MKGDRNRRVSLFGDHSTRRKQAIRTETVAGIRIRYRDGNMLYAWKDGALYTLGEAYAVGILTKGEIRAIRDVHRSY